MLSWWGIADREIDRDSQGVNTDLLVPAVLDAAADSGMHVSWHIEPYGGRTPQSVLADLRYLHERYGGHRAVWRHPERGLPIVFLYDVSAEHSGGDDEKRRREAVAAWAVALSELRGGAADAILLSLYHDRRDVSFVSSTGMDGAYTYFAAEGFTEGSTIEHWAVAKRELDAAGKLFVPSVGPGYKDTGIRPWNHQNTKERRGKGPVGSDPTPQPSQLLACATVSCCLRSAAPCPGGGRWRVLRSHVARGVADPSVRDHYHIV
jgi:glycoprotein endo-alpha-1,2-mannosidase